MSTDPSPMDEITIEGCRIGVRLDGPEARPALVLAHMLGTDLTLWDALVPELAKHFRVVRFDARGHGGSEIGGSGIGAGGFGIDRLGRDVVAVLDHLGIAKAHFCGLSMGGAVGLWLLAHAGERVERAVIAGAAAKLGSPEVWNGRIAAARAQGMAQALPSTMERWFHPAFAEREPEKVEAVAGLIRATAVEGYASCCAALRDMDLREAVRGIAHPVLVLRGADDPSVGEEDARALVEAMENATSQDLAARHCACIEDEAGFLAAVVGFLTAKAAPRRAPVKRIAAKPAPAKAATAKPGTRRVGGRGLTAARQPVGRSAPASQKAVAKAGASRKTAARKTASRESVARVEPARSRAAAPARGRTAARAGTAKPSKAKAAEKRSASKPVASRTVASSRIARAPANRAASAKPAVVKAAGAKPGRSTTKAKPVVKSAKAAAKPPRSLTAKPASTKAKSAASAVKPIAKAKPAKATPAKTKTKPAKATPAKIKLSAAQLRARRGAPSGRRKP